jgi:hypothetical protein
MQTDVQVLQWYLARNLPATPVHPVRFAQLPWYPNQYSCLRCIVCVEGERARGSNDGIHSGGSPSTR